MIPPVIVEAVASIASVAAVPVELTVSKLLFKPERIVP
jgi:hypothetical protein